MNILNDEEIAAAVAEYLAPEADDMHHIMRYTEAIEAAVIRKLSAGVSVEPVAYRMQPNDTAHRSLEKSLNFHKVHVRPDWTIDPLYTATAIAAARVQALEEAAKECDRTASDYKGMFAEDESLYIAATECAKEIRALIGEKTC